MDKLFEYIETNVKLAYKGVTFHFKQYIWFYITLFIVQFMFGTILITHNTAKNVVKEQLNNSYDSHYMFYYLNTDQMLYIKKAANYVFADEYIFDITHVEMNGKETDKNCKYNIGITFVVDPDEGFQRFSFKFMNTLEQLGDVRCAPTPLFSVDDHLADINLQRNLYVVFLAIITSLLLSVLYGIRINNYRFDYGIYMVFGADKRKLLKTSFWEMTVIALLTFVPSLVSSAFAAYLITGRSFGFFGITFISVLLLLVISLILNAAAISFAVVNTSRKKPVDLIISADNSNYVHSPRVSVDILKNKSFFKIVRLSILRYFKYYVGMIFAGVIFSATFVALFFCKDMYLQKQEAPMNQFTLEFCNGYTYTEEDRQALLAVEGIVGVQKEHSTALGELNEHILVNKENTKSNSDLASYDDDYDALDNVAFVAADDEVIKQLDQSEYIGDLSSVLSDEKTVIITDSFTNKTVFDFKPGDKIKISDYLGKIDDVPPMLVGNDLLKEKLKCYLYGYEEYTIGAVIKNSTSNNNMKIYLPNGVYERLTGKKVAYTSVDLYVDGSLSEKGISNLYNTLISNVNNKYNKGKDINVFIRNKYSDMISEIGKKNHNEILLCFVAVLLLVSSQLIWVFSQILFFKKRRNEFSVMRTIGFRLSEIRKIHLIEGCVVSIVGTLGYFGLTYLLCYGIKRFVNSIWFGYSFRYLTHIPINILLIGAVVTFCCGLVSTFIPYVIYKKKSNGLIPE